MKFYTKLLLGIVVLFGAIVPLFLKGPDGQPLMRVSDWLPGGDRLLGKVREVGDKVREVGASLPDAATTITGKATPSDDGAAPGQTAEKAGSAPGSLAADSGKMYKWQDEEGHWHFSTQKPGGVGNASVEALPEVKNVMDAPVEKASDDSMMGLPGLGNAGDMLEKVKRMAAERDKGE